MLKLSFVKKTALGFMFFCSVLMNGQTQKNPIVNPIVAGGDSSIAKAAHVSAKGLLSSSYSEEKLAQILVSSYDFHPYPLSGDNVWQKMPSNLKMKYIADVESLIGAKWEVIPISLFMEFKQKGNGNRTRYERDIFMQRDKLTMLVIAELLENKGRFTKDILNGVWAICDETWWGIPAHYPTSLPDVQTATKHVDLFVAETGSFMSWVYYLMQHKFDSISPAINQRMTYEIKRRLLDPCQQHVDFWWMKATMNWNPWITSNWLTALLIVEKDPALRAKGVLKIMKSIDCFIVGYPNDGGCDEGPGYWDRAGASLFESLDLLSKASNGTIDLSDNPKIKAIGQFLNKAYIGDKYFVNFADARTNVEPNVSIVYRFGSYIKNDSMKQFASYWAKRLKYAEDPVTSVRNRMEGKADGPSPFFVSLGRMLPLFLEMEHLLETPAIQPLTIDNYLPDLQVMFARSQKDTEKGFNLAAKGGHNAEAHNHNDVGSFIVYYDGQPLLVDAGVGSYSAKTFDTKERYKIWTMQSGYHNLPTINGVDQKEGRKFEAKDVKYSALKSKASLSMNIANAYPAEAQVDLWNRTVSLVRSKQIDITENYKLASFLKPVIINLLSAYKVTIIKNHVFLSNGTNRFELKYDQKKFNPVAEVIVLDDPRLSGVWGKQLTRIRLECTGKTLADKIYYSIVRAD